MQLHDILPPIMIADYTYAILLFLALVILSLLYLLSTKKVKKTAFYILSHCDYHDARKTALQFSYYGKKLFTTAELKADFSTIETALTPYKYMQHSPSLPNAIQEEIQLLLRKVRNTDV